MTPQQIDAMKLALEAMKNNKPTHLYCEDIWYSCPKHEDGCANEAEGDECNCGADEINAEFDKAITAIEEVLAEHAMRETQKLGQEIEQEPYSVQQAYAMAQVCLDLHEAIGCKWGDNPYLTISQLKASQPQRTWVGLTDGEIYMNCPNWLLSHEQCKTWVRQIEAKLKEKT